MKIILITIGIIIGFTGALFMNQSIGADLIVEKPVCPVCPSCKITAQRIISDNPDIDLTKYNNVTKFKLPDLENMEVQIGEKIVTKEQIDLIQ